MADRGAHLTSGNVNLALVREAARKELLHCIDRCPGSKAIVWDDKLTGPIGLIAEYSLLKEHEVGKMFALQRGRLPPCDEKNIIFLVRPKVELMETIAENIIKEGVKGTAKEFHVFFVPRRSVRCEAKLQELGVFGTFQNIDHYSVDLFPFDHDLMSLEQEFSFRECYLESDLTSMYHVANSLMRLQALYGIIPKIYGKGDMAKHVTDMLLRKRREMADVEQQITPQIDALLLIDRNVDLVTPLLTQLTYEGLIDEFFGIENTNVQLPAEEFPNNEDNTGKQSVQKDPKKARKVVLNSGEELYAEIRDMNFSAVGPILSREAKRITAEYEEHKSAKTIGEMKDFVHKLPYIQAAKQSLSLHTSVAEVIKVRTDLDSFRESLRIEQEFFNGIDTDKPNPFIEKSIACKEPLSKVLRLMCLQCMVNNGFKQKLMDYYRKELIHGYGFEHMLTLTNIETVGLLKPSGQRTYPSLRKSLKLIVEDVHEQNPNDIAYVHSGYAPLSVRLAQCLSRQTSWRSLEEVLRQLPGQTVEQTQHVPPALLKKSAVSTGLGSATPEGPSRTTLVYFLGGCTYTEIAALRFLGQQENAPTDYVIATTKIITGTSLLESLFEEVDKSPAFNG